MKTGYTIPRDSDGKAQAYAWPGGYPIYYLTDDGDTLCPSCCDTERAQIESSDGRDGWGIVGAAVNYEDPAMFCCHCDKQIPAAYVD